MHTALSTFSPFHLFHIRLYRCVYVHINSLSMGRRAARKSRATGRVKTQTFLLFVVFQKDMNVLSAVRDPLASLLQVGFDGFSQLNLIFLLCCCSHPCDSCQAPQLMTTCALLKSKPKRSFPSTRGVTSPKWQLRVELFLGGGPRAAAACPLHLKIWIIRKIDNLDSLENMKIWEM